MPHASEDLDEDELSRLALAADPDMALDVDAQSLWEIDGFVPDRWLPQWYMPMPMGGRPLFRGWRRTVVLITVLAFVAITAAGLCNTYGQLAFG